MAQRTTVKTRILILSDTHTTKPVASNENDQPSRAPLPKADVLLHCGDLTMVGHLEEYEQAISMLSSIDADLKLVIRGNHDITLDAPYYPRHGPSMHPDSHHPSLPQSALRMWRGPKSAAERASIIYLTEGPHSFALAWGAASTVCALAVHAQVLRAGGFAPQHDEDRFSRHDRCPSGAKCNRAEPPFPDFEDRPVHVMVTHGPPLGRRDQTGLGSVGCPRLLRALTRAGPRVHAFGHIHEGWGAERVRWKKGGRFDWRRSKYIEDVKCVPVDVKVTRVARAAYVDLSENGVEPLTWGRRRC